MSQLQTGSSSADGPHPISFPDENAICIAAYNQNFETFRALNSLMWQIPLIAMTLTGGLWFGVSTVGASPWFQAGLLILAAAGNLGLMVILTCLRYIVTQYLNWLETAYPQGFVSARGSSSKFTKNETVVQVFRSLLFLAALVSLGLLGVILVSK